MITMIFKQQHIYMYIYIYIYIRQAAPGGPQGAALRHGRPGHPDALLPAPPAQVV